MDFQKLLDEFDDTLRVLRTGYMIAKIKPQAKQSTRFGKGHAFTSKKKREYLKELAAQLKQQYANYVPIKGMVRLTILYSFPFSKKDAVFKALGWILAEGNTDLDNLSKPLLDSMQGLCFGNDSKVVELRLRKIKTEYACIAIKIDEVMAHRSPDPTSTRSAPEPV